MISPKFRSILMRFGFLAMAVIIFAFSFFPLFSLETNSANMTFETERFSLEDAMGAVVNQAASKEYKEAAGDEAKIAALTEKYAAITARGTELITRTGAAVSRSAISTLTQIPATFKMMKYVMAARTIQIAEYEAYQGNTEYDVESVASAKETLEELDPSVVTVESMETVCILFTFINPFASLEDVDGAAGAMFFSFIFTALSAIAIVFAFFILPILFLVHSFKMSFALLKAKTDLGQPNNVAFIHAGKMVGMLTTILIVMVLNNDVGLTKYGILAILLCMAMPALSFVLAHLVRRTIRERIYMVIMQGTAVGALIGFLIWAKNLIASGILTYFTRADVLQDVLNKAVGTPESIEEATTAVKNAGVSMLVVMLCGIVCLVWTLTCLPYVAKKILRMACMHTNGKSRKKSKNTAKNIATDEVSFSSFKPLIGSLIPLIPMMFFDIKLPDEVYSAWIASIVGAVIIVAFEIALPILRKVFIRDFDAHNATYVCMGGVIADRDGN